MPTSNPGAADAAAAAAVAGAGAAGGGVGVALFDVLEWVLVVAVVVWRRVFAAAVGLGGMALFDVLRMRSKAGKRLSTGPSSNG